MSDLTSGLLQETAQSSFRVPVFLSYATPFNEQQTKFLERIIQEMYDNLLFPRTLGVSEQGFEPPLTSIRRIVLSSYGCLSVAFRRVLIRDVVSRPGTAREQVYTSGWLTSPYIQIEPSMAYQRGEPVMILREDGVLNDGVFGGILEQGAAPLFIPVFSVDSDQLIDAFFNSIFWKDPFLRWVAAVREYYGILTTPFPSITSIPSIS